MTTTWRKSTYSNTSGHCVELWRKASYSNGTGACVELSNAGAVRDSKNPNGPTLRVDLAALLTEIKSGHLRP